MNFRRMFFAGIVCLSAAWVSTAPVGAEDYICEVMTVKGEAFVTRQPDSRRALREGVLLQPNDFVEVGAQSHVDLAYDSQWNNLSRLEAGSRVTLVSLYPTGLSLKEGGVFARLKALPRHSTFEVQTPTAIASVRGSVYRTLADSGGRTQVFNFSKSSVYVFGLDPGGRIQGDPITLGNSEKSEIDSPGQGPAPPRKMSDAEFRQGNESRGDLEARVTQLKREGRQGRIQNIGEVEKDYSRRLRERFGTSDLGVTDPFGRRPIEGGGALTGEGRSRRTDLFLGKVQTTMKRSDKKAEARRDRGSERAGRGGKAGVGSKAGSGSDSRGGGQGGGGQGGGKK